MGRYRVTDAAHVGVRVAAGHRTMVIAPRYLNGTKTDALYDDVVYTNKNITVWLAGMDVTVGLYHCFKDGVDFVSSPH
eukprot:1943671-Pyramimonas_sp.AAC.2